MILHLCKAETEFFWRKSQLFLEALSDLLVRDPAVLNTRACLLLPRGVHCTLGDQHLRSCIFGEKGGRYTVRYIVWFWFWFWLLWRRYSIALPQGFCFPCVSFSALRSGGDARAMGLRYSIPFSEQPGIMNSTAFPDEKFIHHT